MDIHFAPHELRVIDEQKELETKLINLNAFLNKGQPEFMDNEEEEELSECKIEEFI